MSETPEFYERVKRLYSAVEDFDALPRGWNKDKTVQHINLSHNNLRVHYKGAEKLGKEAAAVRTHVPILSACGIYYFEVKIISKGRDGHIGIGLSGPNVSLNRLPGWEKNSFGYHGGDGYAFQSSGTGRQYGPTFSTGDVIGCCWNMLENVVFYTKNGVNLGVAFREVPSVLYPTIGLQTSGEVVEANFGQRQFAFAVENYMNDCRRRLASRLTVGINGVTSGVESAARRAEKEVALRRLVLDYVTSQGYADTALSFARLTNEPLTDSSQSMHDRRRINRLVVCGKVSRAIRLTQRLHPLVFERNPELLFRLRCRQFIEVLDGYDRIDSRTLVAKSSSKNGTKQSDSAATTTSSSGNSSITISSKPKSNVLNVSDFAYVDAQVDESDADSDADKNDVDAEGGDGDVEMSDSNHSNGCVRRLPTDAELASLIEFGRQLYVQLLTTFSVDESAKRPTSANASSLNSNWWLQSNAFCLPTANSGSRLERERARLLDAFTRLGCAELDCDAERTRTEREIVATELNAAILACKENAYRPALETLLGHLKLAVRQMAAAGSASAGLLQLSDFVNPNHV